jgi:hypothetical protein
VNDKLVEVEPGIYTFEVTKEQAADVLTVQVDTSSMTAVIYSNGAVDIVPLKGVWLE